MLKDLFLFGVAQLRLDALRAQTVHQFLNPVQLRHCFEIAEARILDTEKRLATPHRGARLQRFHLKLAANGRAQGRDGRVEERLVAPHFGQLALRQVNSREAQPASQQEADATKQQAPAP